MHWAEPATFYEISGLAQQASVVVYTISRLSGWHARHGGLEWIRKKILQAAELGSKRAALCTVTGRLYTAAHSQEVGGRCEHHIPGNLRRHGGRDNYCTTKAQQRVAEQKTSPRKARKVRKRHWNAIKKGLRLG